MLESDQSRAAVKPGVKRCPAGPEKGEGRTGARSGGGRAEGQRGGGAERRIGGRVDEVFKGFQRKENSPPLLKKWNTLPSPCSLTHSVTDPPLSFLLIYTVIDWVTAP